MGNELYERIEALSKKYHIDMDDILNYLKEAFTQVYLKKMDLDAELKFQVEKENKVFKIFKRTEVVADDYPHFINLIHITLSKALKEKGDAKLGDNEYYEIPSLLLDNSFMTDLMHDVDRRIKEVVSEKTKEKYEKKIGTLITGDITRVNSRGANIIDTGDVLAIIEPSGKIPRETYVVGTKIIALIEDVRFNGTKCEVVLTRKSKEFVEKIFEQEVEEIRDDTVRIVKTSRVPGIRTCVVVDTDEIDVNPVASCIGRQASRVKSIREWLSETDRITVLGYNPHIETQFLDYFSKVAPDAIEDVYYDGAHKVMNVWVRDWEENIGKFYGTRRSNLLIASEICDLFDIRIFDSLVKSKNEVLQEIERPISKKEEHPVEVIKKVDSVNVSNEKSTKEDYKEAKPSKQKEKTEKKKVSLELEKGAKLETVVKKKKKTDQQEESDYEKSLLKKLGTIDEDDYDFDDEEDDEEDGKDWDKYSDYDE